MRAIKLVISVGIGMALGGAISLFGTYYACVAIDAVQKNPPGSGHSTIGWLFLLFTVPVGLVLGAVVGLLTGRALTRREEKRRHTRTWGWTETVRNAAAFSFGNSPRPSIHAFCPRLRGRTDPSSLESP